MCAGCGVRQLERKCIMLFWSGPDAERKICWGVSVWPRFSFPMETVALELTAGGGGKPLMPTSWGFSVKRGSGKPLLRSFISVGRHKGGEGEGA